MIKLINNMKSKIVSLFMLTMLLVIVFSETVKSQTKEAYIRKGNDLYKAGDYSDAEVNYMKSLSKNKINDKAEFNLGDAYYKQKNYDKANTAFQNLSSMNPDKNVKASSYYNLGNSYFQAKKYEESVNAYKNALRNNPNDEDSKYNLSLATRMLKQQQQQQKNDKNQQNNKDQDKQKQDQQKQDKQKQDQQKKDQEKQDQQKQDQQQAKQDDKKLSKQDAERMLQAINKDEKDLMKNIEKKNIQVAKIKIEKNW